MKIVVGDIYSKIVNPRSNLRALAVIRDVCRAKPNGYMYMPKYRSGVWDGYISLMDGLSSFPSGLLNNVISALDNDGHSVEINRSLPSCNYSFVMSDCLNGITLRDYQVDAANKLLLSGRGIAKMATNSGKTEVMAAIIKSLGFKKSIILLHRKELLHQTADRFEDRLGIKIGRIGDNRWDPRTVTVAMIQTLHGKIDKLGLNGNVLVMVDECHHVSSATMLDTLVKIPGYYRFGFSGTPLKYDILSDLKLIAYTGPVVYELGNKFMMDNEFSAIPYVSVCVIESDDDRQWELNYPDAYNELIVHNNYRNDVIRNCSESCDGVVLVLVERIEHGNVLKELIQGSHFICGKNTTEYRQEMLQRMRDVNGVYIATSIFDEGIDVPSINSLILAGGGKNYIKLLQRIGRGLRKKSNGNNSLEVYDFLDDTNLYLLRQSSRRIKVYAEEGFHTRLLRKSVDSESLQIST